MERILGTADWSGRSLLDIGCGTGYHLPRFAARGARVIGVEPHRPLAAIARRRVRRTARATVLCGAAGALPLPAASVDLVHARWAYFFGPGCEPGLAELDRAVRPGGHAFVIDNDATGPGFGAWFARGFPAVDPAAVAEFWTARGWRCEPLRSQWRFADRAEFETVVRLELPTAVAEELLASDPAATGIVYPVNLWWRRY